MCVIFSHYLCKYSFYLESRKIDLYYLKTQIVTVITVEQKYPLNRVVDQNNPSVYQSEERRGKLECEGQGIYNKWWIKWGQFFQLRSSAKIHHPYQFDQITPFAKHSVAFGCISHGFQIFSLCTLIWVKQQPTKIQLKKAQIGGRICPSVSIMLQLSLEQKSRIQFWIRLFYLDYLTTIVVAKAYQCLLIP